MKECEKTDQHPFFSLDFYHKCNTIPADLWFFLLQLSEIVNQGKLVSDEIIINLLSKRLEAGDAKGESGFILDGFPRTIKQAVSFGA